MKAINVTELKANLSKYLRMASRGTRIVVKDRDEPIAQLGPLPADRESWRARLSEAGRLRPGTQAWNKLRLSVSSSGWTFKRRSRPFAKIPMKYIDASAVLRILFTEPGPAVPLDEDERVVSSQVVEVETFRAVDRERLIGRLDDIQAATKRKELADLLAMLDLAAVDGTVIRRAKSAFAVTVRALDAIHVADGRDSRRRGHRRPAGVLDARRTSGQRGVVARARRERNDLKSLLALSCLALLAGTAAAQSLSES